MHRGFFFAHDVQYLIGFAFHLFIQKYSLCADTMKSNGYNSKYAYIVYIDGKRHPEFKYHAFNTAKKKLIHNKRNSIGFIFALLKENMHTLNIKPCV